MKIATVRNRHSGRRITVVAFSISTKDAHQSSGQIAWRKPGREHLRGAWYGSNLRDMDTYGKVEGPVALPTGGKIVGRASPFLLRKLR